MDSQWSALELVMDYIHDADDRGAISLACRELHRIDAITRKCIKIGLCYSTSPKSLRRFPNLEALEVTGRPSINYIPDEWGGDPTPWINEVSHRYLCLKSVHLKRMTVSDLDIQLLVDGRKKIIQALTLYRCSGFSTDGMLVIARSCRCLKALSFARSDIIDKEGRWLNELAINNLVLESLDFSMTDLKVSWQDLELLASKCKSLSSLKISPLDISKADGFFREALSLEQFYWGSFDDYQNEGITHYENIRFPPKLCCLGLLSMRLNVMNLIFPIVSGLKKLDLRGALLTTAEDHCQLLQRCPNLEVLKVTNMIGDEGLVVVSQICKKVTKLRIAGIIEPTIMDIGISAIAHGCPKLKYLAIFAYDILNSTLEAIGTYLLNLSFFELTLNGDKVTDISLDNGFRSLVRGCGKLNRLHLFLRPGDLSDVGLCYVGKHSKNIRWMVLANVGKSDSGLLKLSGGCPKLEKLELLGADWLSGHALSKAVVKFGSLKYIWVGDYDGCSDGSDLKGMVRPFWNIEVIPSRVDSFIVGKDSKGEKEFPLQVLGYYSLCGRRTHCPDTVILLSPVA